MYAMAQALGFCLFGAVTVTFAPDQPLPQVYAGEPFVVELMSTGALAVDGELHVQSQAGTTVHGLGRLTLKPGRPYWAVVENALPLRGFYSLRLSLRGEDAAMEFAGKVCRVGRPVAIPLPLCATASSFGKKVVRVLRGVPIRVVQIDLDQDSAAARCIQAAEAGFEIVALTDPSHGQMKSADLEGLARTLGEGVVLWGIGAERSTGGFIRFSQAIHRGSPGAAVAPRVATPGALSKLFAMAPDFPFAQVIVESKGGGLDAFRARGDQAGYEGLQIHASYASAPAGTASLAQEMQSFVERLATPGMAFIPSDRLYSESGMEELFVYLNAMNQHLAGTQYVGPLELAGEGVHARVFRSLGDAQGRRTWSIALWASEEGVEVEVPVGRATRLAVRDALYNELPNFDFSAGRLHVSAGPMPIFFTGEGGTPVVDAACAAVRSLAKKIMGLDGFLRCANGETSESLRELESCQPGTSHRAQFFTLLRSLPLLEERWRMGAESAACIGPIVAGIARTARLLCIVEDISGRPFLEPLSEMLMKCGEYRSLYVTSSPPPAWSRLRGDYLMTEVSRLANEAREWAARGRPVEAAAVAALGEWRARSLLPFGSPSPAGAGNPSN